MFIFFCQYCYFNIYYILETITKIDMIFSLTQIISCNVNKIGLVIKSSWKRSLEKSRRFKGMNLQWAITVTYSKTAREISAFHGFRFFARRSHKHRERISIRQRKSATKSERSSYHAFWSALEAPHFQWKERKRSEKRKNILLRLYIFFLLFPVIPRGPLFRSFSFHSVSFAIVAHCTDSHD